MAPAPASGQPKVVYVMGAGQSGSTILGVTLGNCDDFVFAGEVEEWFVKSGRPPWRDRERRDFWNAVCAQVDGADLFGPEVNRCVERSSAVLRVDRWRARARMLRRYREVSEQLLLAIARTAGAGLVVETSHFPLRAGELRKLPGIELYVIYLVRDPHAVVESNLRELSLHEVAERRVRTVRMNANLWLTQLVSVCVFLRQPRERRLFLRHEDFLADPAGVLEQILRWVGSSASVPDLGALRIGVPFEGNRLIRASVIAFRPAGEDACPRSLLTTLMQLPWRAAWGRLGPAAAAGGVRGPAA